MDATDVTVKPITSSPNGASVRSKVRQKIQQLRDELMECPICLVEFVQPRQLPCMHTFCLACLVKMAASKTAGDRLPCPVCNQSFCVPPGGVKALPKNYTVDRLVDLLRSASVQCDPDEEYEPHPAAKYSSSVPVLPPVDFRPRRPSVVTEQPLPTPARPFKDVFVFQNADGHALQVSRSEHNSTRELIWHLIYAREIENDLEKARILFRWLCTTDVTGLRLDPTVTSRRGTPDEVLYRFQQRRATYAEVYQTLCHQAELQCQIVKGRVKGAGYSPGSPIAVTSPTGSPDPGRHAWNAVFVQGHWQLVDCHWATSAGKGKKKPVEKQIGENRQVAGIQRPEEEFDKTVDEFYFMTDPAQFIFSHFPDDSQWQLLDNPLSLADFEKLVPVKATFFRYGLRLIGQSVNAVIQTEMNEVVLRVGSTPDKTPPLAFTFSLALTDGKAEHNGVRLDCYGMHELLNGVSYFRFRLPLVSSYRLKLFAAHVKMLEGTDHITYDGIGEYLLIRSDQQQQSTGAAEPRPYPLCSRLSWGPTPGHYGQLLKPALNGAVFGCDDNGRAELRFRFTDDLRHEQLRFTAELKTSDPEDSGTSSNSRTSGCVLARVVGEEQAVLTVQAPGPGEYGLEIYMCDPELNDAVFLSAGQYLIVCSRGPEQPVNRFQEFPPGYLGPQSMFHKLGLRPSSHPDPYIVCTPASRTQGASRSSSFTKRTSFHPPSSPPSRSPPVCITMSIPRSLHVSSSFFHVDPKRQERRRNTNYVLQQMTSRSRDHRSTTPDDDDGVTIEFLVRCPHPGVHRLEIYARLRHADGSTDDNEDGDCATSSNYDDDIAPLYNYAIDFPSTNTNSGSHVTGSASVATDETSSLPPFPRQTDCWRDVGCRLHAPLDGGLLWCGGREGAPQVGGRAAAISFRVEVPGADALAVVVNRRWQYLKAVGGGGAVARGERKSTTAVVWQGDVELTDGNGGGREDGEGKEKKRYTTAEETEERKAMNVPVEVCAHFPGSTASYRTLLEYTLH